MLTSIRACAIAVGMGAMEKHTGARCALPVRTGVQKI